MLRQLASAYLVVAQVNVVDGAAVFLNGVEGSRRQNLPAAKLTAGVVASSSVAAAATATLDPTPIYWSPSTLTVGNNVVAVEVHVFRSGSASMLFDMAVQVRQ